MATRSGTNFGALFGTPFRAREDPFGGLVIVLIRFLKKPFCWWKSLFSHLRALAAFLNFKRLQTFLCRSSTSSPLKTQNNAVNARRECAGSYGPTLPLYKPSSGARPLPYNHRFWRPCQWIFRLYIFPLFSGRVGGQGQPRYSAREWSFRF